MAVRGRVSDELVDQRACEGHVAAETAVVKLGFDGAARISVELRGAEGEETGQG